MTADLLTDRELQSLRNMGALAEQAAEEIAASRFQAPAEAHGDALDAARFRWLIDPANWNENEDTPSVCTSEDVHWGDKARALIDRHMKG